MGGKVALGLYRIVSAYRCVCTGKLSGVDRGSLDLLTRRREEGWGRGSLAVYL